MAVTERLRVLTHVGEMASTVAADVRTASSKTVENVQRHKKRTIVLALAITTAGFLYETVETAGQIVQEIPIYAQDPERTSGDLQYVKSNLSNENNIVIFGTEVSLPGRKKPDTTLALTTLTRERATVAGLPDAVEEVDEIIRYLKENPNRSTYNPQIGGIENVRQSLLANSEYKKVRDDLNNKENLYKLMSVIFALYPLKEALLLTGQLKAKSKMRKEILRNYSAPVPIVDWDTRKAEISNKYGPKPGSKDPTTIKITETPDILSIQVVRNPKDPQSFRGRWDYNKKGRLTEAEETAFPLKKYTYDSEGRLTNLVSSKNGTVIESNVEWGIIDEFGRPGITNISTTFPKAA